jgi:hypothetical protein
VTQLNPGPESAEEPSMHGAWMFDLLLLVLTGGLTGMAFRQFTRENDPKDQVVVGLSGPTLDLTSADLTSADLSAAGARPHASVG